MFLPVGPDTFTLTNVRQEYNPEDEVACSAEGNPEPDMRWVDQENNTVSDSGILVIEATMEGTQTYSCAAMNVVGGEIIEAMVTITFDVTSKYVHLMLVKSNEIRMK